MVTLPANGSYALSIGDVQQKGGPEYAYRLRIGAPRPDFELRVTPSAVNGGVNANVPLTVHALRRDGFADAITLSLKDAPRGVTLAGAAIPAGSDQVRITLSPAQLQREPVRLVLEGRATVGGKEVVRQAVAAEDMMQAFFYRHLVAESELKLVVRRGAAFRTPPRTVGPRVLEIPADGAIGLRVEATLPPKSQIEKVSYQLNDPPPGISIQRISQNAGGTEIFVRCDGAKAKVGLQGNLIVDISGERTPPAAGGRPAGARQRVPLGTLPAVPFEVVSGATTTTTAMR
jgi:hypothetical protein